MHALDVWDLDQVHDAYIRVRELHSSNTHVMCAHKPSDQNDPSMKDYIDDSEHGGVRVILQLIEDRQLVNKTVFVACKFGGVKIPEN